MKKFGWSHICFIALILALLRQLLLLIHVPEYPPKVQIGSNTSSHNSQTTIAVNVFLYRRVDSARQLLADLTAANYTGHDSPITLVLHVDFSNQTDVRELAEKWEWPHGDKVVKIKGRNIGLRDTWLTAWETPASSDLLLAFEDDIRVSPMYFQWMKIMLGTYWSPNPMDRDPQLLGFSFSAVLLDEINHPFTPWQSYPKIGNGSSVYLHSLPSSWGAVYFGDKWREFLSFYSVRTKPPFYDLGQELLVTTPGQPLGDTSLLVPKSRSNSWKNSWKRFMIDFAYGRGYYMIYPNFPDGAGFSTPLHLQGEHVATIRRGPDPRTGPLIVKYATRSPLPELHQMKVYDLFCKPTSRNSLRKVGDSFLQHIGELGGEYQPLVADWSRPCVLDELLGRRPLGFNDHRKFLMYGPQMGLSNQLLALTHAAVWAHTLGRTLIIPHILWPRAAVAVQRSENTWIEFTEIFDPRGIQAVLPGLQIMYGSLTNMRLLRKSATSIRIEQQPTFDSRQDIYLTSLLGTEMPSVNLRRALSRVDETSIGAALGTCNDVTLALDGLFYSKPASRSLDFYKSLWRAVAQPNQKTLALINHLSKELQSNYGMYSCFHVRLGDLSSVCDAANSEDTTHAWISTIKSQGRKCTITREMVVAAMENSRNRAMLVLSDQPQEIGAFVEGLDKVVITSADVLEKLRTLTIDMPTNTVELLSAVVEQHLCAGAEELWINGFSTFSNSIKTIRGDRNQSSLHYW